MAAISLSEAVQRLKAAVRIEDLVSEYVDLKPEGNWLVGRCPFPHGGTPEAPVFEETPSFKVRPDRQDFYCFACHSGDSQTTDLWGRRRYGSDVIAFWREIRRQELGYEEHFADSLRALAEHIGRPDLAPGPGPTTAEQREATRLKRWAERWQVELRKAPHVRQYLYERGLTDAVINQFGLGFDPEQNGITIPIRDPYSRAILGFSRRTLDPEGTPKYRHSSRLKTSEILFGLDQAHPSISQHRGAIVTEGFFDAMALVSLGFTNTVATMGNAMTGGQACLLRRFTDRLCWWMEDEAGWRGLISMLPTLFGLGFRVHVIDAGQDADDLIRAHHGDAQAVQQVMRGATHSATWVVNRLHDLLPEDQALDLLTPMLRAFVRGTDRALFGRAIQQVFGVDPALLLVGGEVDGNRSALHSERSVAYRSGTGAVL